MRPKRRRALDWNDYPDERPRLTLRAVREVRRALQREAAVEEQAAGEATATARVGRRSRRKVIPWVDDMLTVGLLEAEQRWRGLRSAATLRYQSLKTIEILREIGWKSPRTVTADVLYQVCAMSLTRGCAHSTVAKRLSCLSAIGVKMPADFHFKIPKPPKWYLRPEDEARLPLVPDLDPVALRFIKWACATGLRVEESLRVRAKHISSAIIRVAGVPREFFILAIDGTKTKGAQATIVLSEESVGILRETGWPAMHPDALLFPMPYQQLRVEWLKVRAFLGLMDTPTATLKALRRSFARRATLKGMPPDILRQYLRHSDIATTQSYLNLVGGYSHEEQARFI
jgi:integrase